MLTVPGASVRCARDIKAQVHQHVLLREDTAAEAYADSDKATFINGWLILKGLVIIFDGSDTTRAIIASAKAGGVMCPGRLIRLDLEPAPHPPTDQPTLGLKGDEPRSASGQLYYPQLTAIVKKKQTKWKGWNNRVLTLRNGFLRYFHPMRRRHNLALPTTPRACINLAFARITPRGNRLEVQVHGGQTYTFELDRVEYPRVGEWAVNIQAMAAKLQAQSNAGLLENPWPIAWPGRCTACHTTLGGFWYSMYRCSSCHVDLCSEHVRSSGLCDPCDKRRSVLRAVRRRRDSTASESSIGLPSYLNQQAEKETWWCEYCGGARPIQATRMPRLCLGCSFLPAHLAVCVAEARGLRVQDFNGLADPYAKVYVEDHDFETGVIQNTLHPVWGDEPERWFHVRLEGLGHGIHIALFDSDAYSADDFMGYSYIPFSQLPNERYFSAWLPLGRVPGQPATLLGEVRVVAVLSVPAISHIAKLPASPRLTRSGRQPASGLRDAVDSISVSVDRLKDISSALNAGGIKTRLEALRTWRNPLMTMGFASAAAYAIAVVPAHIVPAIPLAALGLALLATLAKRARAVLESDDKKTRRQLLRHGGGTGAFMRRKRKKKRSVRGGSEPAVDGSDQAISLASSRDGPAPASRAPRGQEIAPDKSLWPHQKFQKRLAMIRSVADDVAGAVDFVDRVGAIVLWKNPRKTVWLLVALLAAVVACCVIPTRALAVAAVCFTFGDYVASRKFAKVEKYQKVFEDPSWHLHALASREPHTARVDRGLRWRKKRSKWDPLVDYIRRAPLMSDDHANEANVPHELANLRISTDE